jgi:hypothetical protein
MRFYNRPVLRLDLLPIRDSVRATAAQSEHGGVQVVQQTAIQGVAFMDTDQP